MMRREIVILMLVLLVGRSYEDVSKDKQECASQLTGLATCLPYVSGQAKAPTPDCCTGLKQVLKDSKKCLCLLVKDRNDPNLGLKFNASLALSLPHSCQSPHDSLSISQCLELLHLAPNSPEAKAFADFTKAPPPTASTSPTTPNSADKSSDSGSGGSSSEKATSDGMGGIQRSSWLAASTLLLLLIV